MELLYSCSFMRRSNYFLSNFRSLRIYGVTSFCAPNRDNHIKSCKFFARSKTSTASEKDNLLMYSMRPYSNNSIFDKLKSYSGSLKRRWNRSVLALHLYKSFDNINFQEFYTFLEMPDTFNSWFLLMELHLWMLLSQLMDREKEGIRLRKELVEMFWYDVESRIDEMKLNTPRIIKKQLSELTGRLPITLLVYDEGLLSTDLVLAGGLWYKFFEKKDVDPRKLEVLIKYIRHQQERLNLKEEVFSGGIQQYKPTLKNISDVVIIIGVRNDSSALREKCEKVKFKHFRISDLDQTILWEEDCPALDFGYFIKLYQFIN